MDFVILYARYLQNSDFYCVKTSLKELAQRGQINAMAFYVSKVQPSELGEQIKIQLKDIDKTDLKTPEQWQVIASKHLWDSVDVILNKELKIENVKDLLRGINLAYQKFDFLKNEFDHRRFVMFLYEGAKCKEDCEDIIFSYLHRYFWLSNCLKNQCTEFVQAVQNAQNGFFERYLQCGDLLDASMFLDMYKSPLSQLFESDNIEKLMGTKDFDIYKFAKLIKKDRQTLKQSKDILSEFGFANAMNNIYGGTGLIDSILFDRKNEKIIQKIANLPLSSERTK